MRSSRPSIQQSELYDTQEPILQLCVNATCKQAIQYEHNNSLNGVMRPL